MLTHFDRNPAAVPDRCDLLVVGAGPAGLALALEAARARPDWHVILAEAGGLQPPRPESRNLLAGRSVGAPYPLESSRLRYFGGTSGHWGGWSRPLDGCDFLPAPGGRGPGWPITPQALASGMQAAHRWCEIPDHNYDASLVRQRHPDALLDFSGSNLFDNGLFRFSPPTRFGSRYQADVETRSNLTCLLGASACRLGWNGRHCNAVGFRSLDGNSRSISADHVVLAMGGMETTRLLLHAATDGPVIDGLQSPALGAYFADHLGMRPGELLARAGLRYTRFDDESGAVMPLIVPRLKAMQDNGWMNACMMLMPMPAGGEDRPSYAGNAAFGLAGEYWRYGVQMILEPHCVQQSRITLDDERDALGMRRLRLDWRVARETAESGYAMFAALTRELGRLGLGRGRLRPVDLDALVAAPSQSFHHMGTTRMAESAVDGVVDADLRIHGSENVYVASSSVFPRYGFANPTLTIVALACRLAAQLAGRDDSRSAA